MTPPMLPEEIARRLHAGKPVFGTLVVSTSPRWPEMIRQCGLDFVFIDTEHVAIDRHQLSWMCQTYAAMGLSPIVRIPSADSTWATMVLDGGASGVIAPYVETSQQVRQLRGAVKMRPIKGATLSRMLDGQSESDSLDQYLANVSRQKLLIVNIESVPAIEALNEILTEPGLDAVLIGPHDLSCSLGIPEQYDHPEFLTACETIFRKARAHNVGAGIHYWGNAEEQAAMLERGANLLIHSADIKLVQKHLSAELRQIRHAIGLSDSSPDQSDLAI
ncbi:aldolase/citrate lyase family protein [Roseiconus lacunae]|uniref:HpcH/HpaI aldolase family protein n=1 Tax=Roseiconus lacunae TaxID=2605694 RepID=UPI0030914132|nr:aldolase/citrate lyase family protein [Stieleria sp. HD01]